MFNLKDKVAVITGGANGIGKATALLFAKQSAEVHILDMNEEAAKTVAEEVAVSGGKGFSHMCDVTKQQQVKEIFDSINKIDILVNSAGISHIGKLEDTSEEDFDKIYNANVKGVYNCLHSAIAFMKKNGGVILNLASIAANVGIPDRFAYSMSKGAVSAMTLFLIASTSATIISFNICGFT